MFFILERTKKILQDLKKYRLIHTSAAENITIKDGLFSGLLEVDTSERSWSPYQEGALWGGKDTHVWFRTCVTIPQSLHDQAVVLNITSAESGWDATNPQFILYIDGDLVQGLDINHQEVILAKNAHAGDSYQIDLHAYSGMSENKHILKIEMAALDERVNKLYYHLSVPMAVAEKMDPDSKASRDIQDILQKALNLIDFRKPMSELFHQSVMDSIDYLDKEFYEGICGHNEVIATCVGHTHIDVAWLWTLAQTREKVVRSFSTVLKLMEEYPEYIFMSSQPQLYQFLKEDQPEIYEKIKERVREGRWEVEGAMWVEADCNLSSGESLIRQVMFGTRFFEREFGVKNKILWLPDVFGYSAALPQILIKSGIEYFMTTKIAWNQFNKMPNDTFMWRGLDGTEILTHFVTTKDYEEQPKSHFTTYNGDINPSQVMGAWQRYQQKSLNNDVLISYGYGDGGGGPTIQMLENARRLAKGIPGCPTVQMGTSRAYFDRLWDKVKADSNLPKWVGELYLEYHRGTYTSMARNKRYNRKSEILYQDLEFVASMSMLLGHAYPQDEINQGWEKILLNQFHDIIPGSSIFEVYEDSKIQYEALIQKGNLILSDAMGTIMRSIQLEERSVVVMNTLSFDRDDVALVDYPLHFQDPVILDDQNNVLPSQRILDDAGKPKLLMMAVDVPSKGYKSYKIRNREEASLVHNSIHVSGQRLENQYYLIQLDANGTITSLYDKVNLRQVLKEGERGNRLLAFEDKPMNYDNWDIDIYYQEKMWEVDQVIAVEVIEEGPVRGCLRITKQFLDSMIVQNIYIYRDIPRIDFSTYVDWKEDQILLKAAFPVDIHTDKATYDVQFGNVERPTHWNTSWDYARFEVCAHKWADLSEDDYGVSLLNDCKYGHDIRDGNMRLTLLKSGNEPNPKADREKHQFCYALYPHAGDWKTSRTPQMAYGLNTPLYACVEEAHAGILPDAFSFMKLNADNVIAETIKKAEDGEELVIRFYECYNRRTSVNVVCSSPLKEVTECDLMEKDESPVTVDGSGFNFTIKPYEIKTFKIKTFKIKSSQLS